jgi:hypothetical protein
MNATAITSNGRAQEAPISLPVNGQPTTLVEIVEHEALGYRAWGTPVGDFLARQMDRLGQLIAWASATTPADFEDRLEVYDRELRDRHYRMGFEDGLQTGRRECRCGQCFLDRD